MLSLAVKKIAYSKSSLKVIRRLPADEAKRITSKIEQYASDPKSLANNVKALVDSPFIRLRVSDWRIILDDQGNVLEVLKIGPRGSVYDWEIGHADHHHPERGNACCYPSV